MNLHGPYMSIRFANSYLANTFADQKARKLTTGAVQIVDNEVRIYNFDTTEKQIITQMAGSENASVRVINEENDIEQIIEEILRG